MERSASAVWNGDMKDGKGNISTQSGLLSEAPYSFVTRFENGKGTNPEELIAAARTGFTMAFRLQDAGYTATELDTEEIVTLERKNEDFRIRRSALTLRASVPDMDQGTFARVAQDAELNGPLSRMLRAETTLDAKLI